MNSEILDVAQRVTQPVNRPIGAHFHSGGGEFSYFGEELDESFGEPEKPIAITTVGQGSAEHLHGMLSGEHGVDEAVESFTQGRE
jgi:hypothetical protein